MDPDFIGHISELVATVALTKAGFTVSIPTRKARYDLILDQGDSLRRVQVKTGRLRNGAIYYSAASNHGRGSQRYRRTYHGSIDLLAVVLGSDVYLIPVDNASRSEGCLRLTPPRNNQVKGVRWAKDFKL